MSKINQKLCQGNSWAHSTDKLSKDVFQFFKYLEEKISTFPNRNRNEQTTRNNVLPA